MNHLKHMFGLPVSLSHCTQIRNSSLTRSAGSQGRDTSKTREIFIGPRDSSPEPRLSDKSYARLIADYTSKSIRCNGDSAASYKSGFFTTKPFEHLASVSSLVKPNNAGSAGLSLCTKSSSRSSPASAKIGDIAKTKKILGDADTLKRVADRAEWLNEIVRAHRLETKNVDVRSDKREEKKKNVARASTQKTVKSILKNGGSAKEFRKFGDGGASFARSISDNPNVEAKNMSVMAVKSSRKSNAMKNEMPRNGAYRVEPKNVSVTVKPLEENDSVTRAFSTTILRGDSATMLVRVSEDSTSTSSSILRHIDLRINGQPVTDTGDYGIRKSEKSDIVSLADRIEISIPVCSDSRENVGDDATHITNSMINLCITRQVNESKGDDRNLEKVGRIGDARPDGSCSPHPSSFYIPRVQNPQKIKTPSSTSSARSKVVPWWTTEESFRRSETVRARSSESNVTTKESAASGASAVAARGKHEEIWQRDEKEVAISNARMGIKTVVTEPPGSPKERSRKREKAAAASRIIELRKKSEERQKEIARQRFTLSATRPVAKQQHATKVKSTETNRLKKGTPSAINGGILSEKSHQAITPTPDNVSKKLRTTVSARDNKAGGSTIKSMTGLWTRDENNNGTNNHLSKHNFKESISAKPITATANNNNNSNDSNNNNDVRTSGGGGATGTGQTPKTGGSAGSKTGSKPQDAVAKSETKTTPPRTYGSIKVSPTRQQQSPSQPVNRPSDEPPAFSIKPNDKTASNKIDDILPNTKNSPVMVAIKPIEKKKDGTLIDYGLTVPTRKKPERKLPDSQIAKEDDGKKIEKKEEPVIVATIKEVIPMTRNKDFRRDGSINRSDPARSKKNGFTRKNGRRTFETADKKHDPPTPEVIILKGKMEDPKDSKTMKKDVKIDKKPANLSKSKMSRLAPKKDNPIDSKSDMTSEATSPEKKLLYSAWLRRNKERNGHDPDK